MCQVDHWCEYAAAQDQEMNWLMRPLGRWIHERLFGRGSVVRLERDLVEDGRMEVDWLPPDRRGNRQELEGNLTGVLF
jgi:hypothetical protein